MSTNEFEEIKKKINGVIESNFYGCLATEEELSNAVGARFTCYDQYIDDGCDGGEVDNYVMCASFNGIVNGESVYVRIYYGDITEEIGYVDIRRN